MTQENYVRIAEGYTPTLQKDLEDFRSETLSKMDELKAKHGLEFLEIAHCYPGRILVIVNDDLIVPNTFGTK